MRGPRPGLPYSRFESDFSGVAGPGYAGAVVVLRGGSTLVDGPPAPDGSDAYTYDAGRAHVTTLGGTDQGSVWLPLPAWNWTAPAAENAVAYETPPLATDTVMVGTGSADLWIKTAAPDVDLQATITEVRPDGEEMLVQSGWLRASRGRSHRAPRRCAPCTRTPPPTSGR